MSVALKNTSRRIRTFNLTPECESAGLRGQTVKQMRKETSKKGKAVIRPREVCLPPVLTLLPGELRKDLPDAVLNVPSIARALNDTRDGLRLVAHQSKKSKRSRAPATPAPEPAMTESDNE